MQITDIRLLIYIIKFQGPYNTSEADVKQNNKRRNASFRSDNRKAAINRTNFGTKKTGR